MAIQAQEDEIPTCMIYIRPPWTHCFKVHVYLKIYLFQRLTLLKQSNYLRRLILVILLIQFFLIILILVAMCVKVVFDGMETPRITLIFGELIGALPYLAKQTGRISLICIKVSPCFILRLNCFPRHFCW